MNIKIYTPSQINSIEKACRIASATLDYITPFVKAGISTLTINNLCDEFIKSKDGTSAPLEVEGYKHAICTTLNDEICHGVPSDKVILTDGDIINIDVTVNLNGFYGDTSRMYTVGKVSEIAEQLIKITKLSLKSAIKIVKPYQPFSAIGKEIERIVNPYNYGIIRDFCGHGIGTMFHGSPQILHYYHSAYDKILMKEGMVFTIEPMINESSSFDYYIDKSNGWTAFTRDGTLSAQLEHTMLVTKNGVKILT